MPPEAVQAASTEKIATIHKCANRRKRVANSRRSTMRMPALILTVMAITLLIAPASPQDKVNLSRKEQKEASAKKVKKLQRERAFTLAEVVEDTVKLFEKGLVKYEEIFEARLLALEAAVDASEKESDRMTFYKNIVDVMKEYEKYANDRLEAGRSSRSAVLKVKARRLQAEINLERAKAELTEEAK
jgi:hypothetical protein